jgi:PBP1b-binding outer membrane lipoprotein LpoB
MNLRITLILIIILNILSCQTIKERPIQNENNILAREATIDKLNANKNQNLLAEIAKDSINSSTGKAAVEKLDIDIRLDLIVDIAKNGKDDRVREAALNKIDANKHTNLIAEIAKNSIKYLRIPVMSATHSGGSRPPVPDDLGR